MSQELLVDEFKWVEDDLPFLPGRMKVEKVEKLLLIYTIKLNMLFT